MHATLTQEGKRTTGRGPPPRGSVLTSIKSSCRKCTIIIAPIPSLRGAGRNACKDADFLHQAPVSPESALTTGAACPRLHNGWRPTVATRPDAQGEFESQQWHDLVTSRTGSPWGAAGGGLPRQALPVKAARGVLRAVTSTRRPGPSRTCSVECWVSPVPGVESMHQKLRDRQPWLAELQTR